MPVGTYAKDTKEKEKTVCEMCGQEAEPLFKFMKAETGKEVKSCESCYKQYWLEHGYKV